MAKKYLIQDDEEFTVKCNNCDHTFDYLSVPEAGMGYCKCPNCGEPVTQKDELTTNEEEKTTVTTYKPGEDDNDMITKALKRAKEDKVSFNDDGTVAVQEDSIKEVEKTSVMSFNITKGNDVKDLQQMFDRGVDSKKITVGTDGTIQIRESKNNPNIKITSGEFKRMIKNHNKINLSESEIMNILFESENPRMKKSELIEEITNQIISEADMNDDVKRKFDSGESDYSEHLDPETVKAMSERVFGDVQQNIRNKTGRQNVDMNDIQQLLGNSLVQAIQKEQRIGVDRLQQKAVAMIRSQFNIPEGAVDFQAEITGLPQLGGRPIQKGNLQYSKGTKTPPEGKNEEELKPEITRRRLTNAMMHGAARKSQNLHHMSDELRTQDPSLNTDYSNIMAANDAMYWMMSDEAIEEEGRGGVHAGNVRVDLSNPERPKIIAQGMVFPILLHELAKGVMELMSLWSLPKDKGIRDYVLDKTDHLAAETNDIRLGSHLWVKFVEQIPVDNQEVISLTFNIMQQLPTDEFNSIMSGLADDREEAKGKVRELANEAIEELKNEEYEEAISQYGEPQGEEEPPEDDVNTMLGGDKQPPVDEPQDEEPDYSRWSQKDINDAINDALDAGDYETVQMLSQYLR